VNPGGGLITLVNAQLRTEPDFVQRIRDMHAAEMPLLDMVDQLGLARDMSDPVRAIVQQLSPSDVVAIRRATLDMLDRAEHLMPVDCNLSQTAIDDGTPVNVAVVDEAGRAMIQVRATGAAS
jgi:hypothetical protein